MFGIGENRAFTWAVESEYLGVTSGLDSVGLDCLFDGWAWWVRMRLSIGLGL